MKIINELPSHYIEHDFFGKIIKNLNEETFRDLTLIATMDYRVLPKYGQDVIVLLTAGDERGGLPEWHQEVRYVFKHHLDFPCVDNVWHLPLPYVNNYSGSPSVPIENRQTDVLFAGRQGRGRDAMFAAVNKLTQARPDLKIICYNTGRGFAKGWAIGTYSRQMSNAKIILSPEGSVRAECIRFTEAVACGSAIIACKHPDLPCFNETPAIYLDNWANLQGAVESLLVPGRLAEVGAGMAVAWDTYFSPEAQARLMNKVVGGDDGHQ